MNGELGERWWQNFLVTFLLLMGTFLTGTPPAQGAAPQYQYTATCHDCHGTSVTDPGNPPNDIRPLDSVLRNLTSGAFRGNHRTHMSQTTNATACDKCHTGTSSYGGGHMNERIDMSANLNSSPVAAKYSKAVSPIYFNWTSNQSVMGTCANVNCHFEATTPTWGGAAYSYPADCSQCHGAPPSGGTTGTAGTHAKHDTYYLGASQCKKCHADHVAEGNRFSHATSAANRGIAVQLRDPADVAGGSYSGSGANYLPSQSGAQIFGNCTNLYCHSQGQSSSTFTGGNAAKSTPTWGATIPANCAGCHGGNVASGADAIASNAHTQHINNSAKVGRNIGCKECHAATAASDSTIATVANHVDKNVNIKFDDSGINKNAYNPTYGGADTTVAAGAAKAPGSALGAGCANLYCHSDGHPVSGSRTYRTIAWNAAPIGCTGCHGTSTTSGYPDHASAGVGIAGSNSHGKHAASGQYAIGCVRCHSGTTSDNINLINGGAHLNGTGNIANTDVKFDTFNPSGSYSGQTCSTTYCHGSGNGNKAKKAAVWGDSMPADCTGCHGGNAAAAAYNIISSGRHTAHINNAAVLGTAGNFACIECHALTVDSSDRAISDKTRHVNAMKDYSGIKAGGSSNYTTATGVCTNVYCHSSGQATPIYRNMTGSKAWRASGTLACTKCHGYETTSQGAAFNSVAGEPNYVSGAVGSATANTHKKHVGDRGIIDSRGCTDCHRRTVDQGVAGKLKNYSSLHLNKTRNINFAVYAGYSGNYTSSSKTCSNTYCHSSGSPRWGGSALSCNSCHSAKADDLQWSTKSAHKLHWEGTDLPSGMGMTPGNGTGDASYYRFACSSCHASPTIHANGPVSTIQAGQVYFGYSSTGRKGTYTAAGASAGQDGSLSFTAGGNCTTTYCHSNGRGSDGATAVVWSTTANSGTPAVRCAACHHYTAIASGKHGIHVATYGYSCAKCHSATTTTGTTITDKTKHVNKVKEVVWDAATDGGTAFSSPNCTNIYCHSQGTTYSTPYTGTGKSPNIAATWSGGALGCGGCHDGLSAGPAYTNGSPKANSHNKHVSILSYGCDKCHYDVTTTGNSITTASLHVNKVYNVSAGSGVSFTIGIQGSPGTPTRCDNISCHGNNNATWGTTINCQDCHTGSSDVDNFTTPFTPGSTVAILKSSEWAATGHGKVSGTYASGNPAAGFTASNACLYCHDSTVNHNVTTNTFRLRNYSTIAWGRNAPCQVCHATTGSTGVDIGAGTKTATKKVSSYHYGSNHGASNNGGQFCWDCHDGHGDANDYMIHGSVAKVSDRVTGTLSTTVAVTFTLSSPPNAVWSDYVKTPGNNGICQACHSAATSLKHFRSDLYDSNHNPGTRCTVCHSHSESGHTTAFKPSGNCDLCHGYPPVRRGLAAGTVFRQNNYSSAKFEDYSGGGGSHTIEKHVPATVRASEGWANCAGCHSNGDMNNPATHTMQTPVKPSKLTIDLKERRKADSSRSLGSERYSGRLTDDHDNATGSCSNVNCHFKPSKKWSTTK